MRSGPSLGRKRPRRAADTRRQSHIALQQYDTALHKMQGANQAGCYADSVISAGSAVCRTASADVQLARQLAAGSHSPGGISRAWRRQPPARGQRRTPCRPIDFAPSSTSSPTAVRPGDPAVLPHGARRRGQVAGRRLRSGHRGRPRRRSGHAQLIKRTFPDPRHRRRGVRQRAAPTPNMSGCSIRSTAPSAFISGLPVWGTLIGLTRNGAPVLRDDAPAVHRASASPATAAARTIAGPAGERKLRVAAPARPCATRCCLDHEPACS